MAFVPGDLVHVAAIGKGIVREARNGGRYLVDVKGRSIVTTADQLTARDTPRKSTAAKTARVPGEYQDVSAESAPASIDLHGKTVAEALEIVSEFVSCALMSGSSGVRLIHGRSGGRIKAAVHAQLKALPAVRRFRVDPQNPGVTLVEF
jgi:DNA mismatch repair protein MutS2